MSNLNTEIYYIKAPSNAHLIEASIKENQGHLSLDGALVVKTGTFTGRAAQDKYVVFDRYSENRIDWSKVTRCSQENYSLLKTAILAEIKHTGKPLYYEKKSVGANHQYSLGIEIFSSSPSHILFCRHLFREELANPALGEFSLIHWPINQLEENQFGLKRSTAIVINFEEKEIIVTGTLYAGEIKKSVFSVMNTLLPELGVLPMHAGANIGADGKVSAFFGLSGTGKTTLSTDEGMKLVGDDEHGLSTDSLFNFEGGCYAKTLGLSEATEPQIYRAVNRFGTLLENVFIDEKTGKADYFNASITENGRASYPLAFIDDAHPNGVVKKPDNIFFLSADAYGVLPPVSKLNPKQAAYFFRNGYTAKLAGTEIGLKGVKATFSHSFGAPFMMRPKNVYASLLEKILSENAIDVWLINTGWCKGPFGEGERFKLKDTRQIIRQIQKGKVKSGEFETGPFMELAIPKFIEGVDEKLLNPKKSWKDERKYEEMALKLKLLFKDNEELS